MGLGIGIWVCHFAMLTSHYTYIGSRLQRVRLQRAESFIIDNNVTTSSFLSIFLLVVTQCVYSVEDSRFKSRSHSNEHPYMDDESFCNDSQYDCAVVVGSFTGQLSVTKSVRPKPYVIPECKKEMPKIPEGLKYRLQAFGAGTFHLTTSGSVDTERQRQCAGLSLALVHKHVKISVGKWILETTRPHTHVKNFDF